MIRMSIFRKSGAYITFPINPGELETAMSGSNQIVNIVSLGDVAIPGERGLTPYTINSFFPADDNPQQYVKFIMDWWSAKEEARLIGEGLDLDSLVIVENFTTTRKAGEEDDIYFNLEMKEYRPYGAKVITIAEPTTAEESAVETARPTTPNRTDNKPATPQTYTVKRGDSLWAISKRLSKQGGRNWRELYNIPENKKVIGNNPNLIYAGQVLQIPQNWVT